MDVFEVFEALTEATGDDELGAVDVGGVAAARNWKDVSTYLNFSVFHVVKSNDPNVAENWCSSVAVVPATVDDYNS